MRAAIYLVGPTASGKSAVALSLAEAIGGEIISVDSMQVYRGMNIGTAKPSPEELRRVPHHLIDVSTIGESFDAARFVLLARQAEAGIRERGKHPIYCGGTGLYFNALTKGLPDAPPPDAALRSELERVPLETLLDELRDHDPSAFARIDRRNPRRVVRAVELLRMRGKEADVPNPKWQNSSPPGLWIGLERTREDLHRRIDARVDRMFQDGLVEETRTLLEQGLRENRTALQALGYRQVVEHLDGQRDLPSTISLVKTKTRQYAKRQMTWFRRQLPVEWIAVSPEADPPTLSDQIAGRFAGS